LVGGGIAYAFPDASTTASDLNPESLTFWSILQNNLAVAVLLTLGNVTLGVTTVVGLLLSGVTNGGIITSGLVVATNEFRIALLVLPHAVFEIPGLLVAGQAGFQFPFAFVRYLRGERETLFTMAELKETLLLAGLSLFLITIAAMIEVFVTFELR